MIEIRRDIYLLIEKNCDIMATNNRKSTLFIGDLASICTEKDIHDVFSPFGKISEIKIMRSDDNNRSLSYGFVRFSQPAAAELALTALDGSLLCGRNLR